MHDQFGYDALDNLRTASVGGRATSVAFGSRNLPLSLSTNGGAAQAIGHDARGNVSQAGAQSFSFDLGNRLLSSSGNSYGYDGHGRRVRILSSDGSTRYQVYGADGQLLWSTNAGGGRATSHTAYIQLGGQQIAEVDVARQSG